MKRDDFAFIFDDIKFHKAQPANQDCWVFQFSLGFWGKVETVNFMYLAGYYAVGTTQENGYELYDEIRENLIDCVTDDLLWDVITVNVAQYCEREEFEIESIYEDYKKNVDKGNEKMRKMAIYEDRDVFLLPVEYVESRNVKRIPA